MVDNQEQLDELKKNHLKNIKNLLNEPLTREYFQYLSNSVDSTERFKLEQRKLSKLKTNEKQLEHQNKQFTTNWNLDYCEYCKLDYWPSNCQVYMLPKCRMTQKNAKIYMKYKLFNYKPKYKSYKDKLIKKILNKGIDLVYKCKRCSSSNMILHETKRNCSFKLIKLNKKNLDKSLLEKAKTSKTIHSTSFNSKVNAPVLIETKKSIFNGKKKFQSLQARLKQNEMEQQSAKNRQQLSLNDFLMQLT